MSHTHPAPSTATLVGSAVPRREDPRLLTGRGRFVDDIDVPRMLHAQFVRASVASGRLTSLDLSAVREVPGVVAAFTADDLELNAITAGLHRPPRSTCPPGCRYSPATGCASSASPSRS